MCSWGTPLFCGPSLLKQKDTWKLFGLAGAKRDFGTVTLLESNLAKPYNQNLARCLIPDVSLTKFCGNYPVGETARVNTACVVRRVSQRCHNGAPRGGRVSLIAQNTRVPNVTFALCPMGGGETTKKRTTLQAQSDFWGPKAPLTIPALSGKRIIKEGGVHPSFSGHGQRGGAPKERLGTLKLGK